MTKIKQFQTKIRSLLVSNHHTNRALVLAVFQSYDEGRSLKMAKKSTRENVLKGHSSQ